MNEATGLYKIIIEFGASMLVLFILLLGCMLTTLLSGLVMEIGSLLINRIR